MLNEDTHLVKDVKPGKTKQFDLHIAKLPTGTVINIHVFVYRGKKPGPVLLLTGGLHGDEVNGVEIIRRLMKNNLLMPDAGTVIAIPVLNIYGFLNFARDLPDGKDANRSFPGTTNGSLASRMAYNIQKNILPFIDYGLDFHTGGSNRSNYPQIRCDFTDATSVELANLFAPPFLLH
ncbi:MAG: succinylglutamate desuccinylase/aspartoacylase family protein, partial [Bacteroidia bacterium]